MSDHTPAAAGAEDAALAAPPDAQNPAIHDAKKTFLATAILAALFIGSVFLFILRP